MSTKFSTILATIVGSLALCASASPVAEQGAAALQARAVLGGVNVDAACKNQQGSGWSAVTVGNGWADWKCKNGDTLRGVNMNVACSVQYGNFDAWPSHGADVWSWVCNI